MSLQGQFSESFFYEFFVRIIGSQPGDFELPTAGVKLVVLEHSHARFREKFESILCLFFQSFVVDLGKNELNYSNDYFV